MFTVGRVGRQYINNSLHLARKYVRIFVRGHHLFLKGHSFPHATLEETVSFEEQIMSKDKIISKHIFTPNGDYRVYYSSNLLRKVHSFENWGICKQ